MRLYNRVSTSLQQTRNIREGWSCSSSHKGEHAPISCVGCDPGLPCTVPQGYCRAFTILFPIFTSSVLPTTANGKWLFWIGKEKQCWYPAKTPESSADSLQILATECIINKNTHMHAAAQRIFTDSDILSITNILSHRWGIRTKSSIFICKKNRNNRFFSVM